MWPPYPQHTVGRQDLENHNRPFNQNKGGKMGAT